MKIETTITPRRDGSVSVTTEDGKKYVFQADETGALVCDVANETHAAWMLGLGDFHPADAEDFEAASLLVQTDDNEGGEGGEGGIPGMDDDEEDGDEPVDMNAAPIEEPASAVAAPAPARVARPRSNKAEK